MPTHNFKTVLQKNPLQKLSTDTAKKRRLTISAFPDLKTEPDPKARVFALRYSEKLSIRAISEVLRIPIGTIHRWLSNPDVTPGKLGQPRYLNDAEETRLLQEIRAQVVSKDPFGNEELINRVSE